MLTNSHIAMARGCDITTNVTCRFAQSDGGSTIQSVPKNIWPQHHTLSWSCSMAPQQVNNDSTILGKPELQLLQVRRNLSRRIVQRCPWCARRRQNVAVEAIHAKLCSHTRKRGSPGIRKSKMRERGIHCENPFQREIGFISLYA